MKTFKIASLVLIASLALTGLSCITSPVCLAPSSTHIPRGAAVENLGHVSGSDTTGSILGLWMWARPDISKALINACDSKGADALVNVTCYETRKCFILFSTTTVTVEGEAVKIIPEKVK